MSLSHREKTILAMHKAGLNDREMLEVLAMRGDEAALRFMSDELAEAERYSASQRLHDGDNSAYA